MFCSRCLDLPPVLLSLMCALLCCILFVTLYVTLYDELFSTTFAKVFHSYIHVFIFIFYFQISLMDIGFLQRLFIVEICETPTGCKSPTAGERFCFHNFFPFQMPHPSLQNPQILRQRPSFVSPRSRGFFFSDEAPICSNRRTLFQSTRSLYKEVFSQCSAALTRTSISESIRRVVSDTPCTLAAEDVSQIEAR